MTANDLLMQLQSDLLGISVVRPAMKERTAMGAAVAAGLAVGLWDITVLENKNSKRFYPSVSSENRDARYARWKRAIPRSIGWAADSDTVPPPPPRTRSGLFIGGALGIGFVLGMGATSLWRKL